MNTLEIDKAVTEINQKIVQSSIKKTNLNNPIKVLVKNYYQYIFRHKIL